MELDPYIYIIMHSVLSLKTGCDTGHSWLWGISFYTTFVSTCYVGRKRTAGSPPAVAEQQLHATAASGASQSGALLERTCGHTSLHRCCTQHRTFNFKGKRQKQVPDTSWCCSKGYGAQHSHWSHLRHQVPPLPWIWPYAAKLPYQIGDHCYCWRWVC
jgi:hypothetical protein